MDPGSGLLVPVAISPGVATLVPACTVVHEMDHAVRSVVGYTLLFQAATVVATFAPVRYPSRWGKYAGRTGDGYEGLELLRG